MEGPRKPGYYASVGGTRRPGERPGLPKPGEPLVGPVALHGQVHRYGPGQTRFYLLKAVLGLPMDIECVWTGPDRPVPELDEPDAIDMHLWVTGICMKEAQAEAERLNRLDPKAKGIR